MAKQYCVHGHHTPLSSDRDSSGFCRQCRRERSKKLWLDRKQKQAETAAMAEILRTLLKPN